MSDLKERILATLREHGGSLRGDQLNSLPGSPTDFFYAMQELKQEGRIRTVENDGQVFAELCE